MNVVNTILFPSSFFDGEKVDEDLQSEYEAVLNTRLWNTIFFKNWKDRTSDAPKAHKLEKKWLCS